MAQFIMVTLRKVSLTLADHHIGITHAGDGRSQRITDFDRAAALEMSEEIEAEERARTAAEAEREAMPELPSPEDMPRTPEPLSTPKSIGGLAERAGVEVSKGDVSAPESEQGDLQSLRERTEDITEDIGERDEAEPAPSVEQGEDDATEIELEEA
jgi:hypothetical protein